MTTLQLVLLIFAFVFFVLAALGVPSSRFSLVAAGLAFWVLTEFVGRL